MAGSINALCTLYPILCVGRLDASLDDAKGGDAGVSFSHSFDQGLDYHTCYFPGTLYLLQGWLEKAVSYHKPSYLNSSLYLGDIYRFILELAAYDYRGHTVQWFLFDDIGASG